MLEMYPSSVKGRLSAVDAKMDETIANAKGTSSAIKSFVNDSSIKGDAFDQSKKYFSIFLTLVEGVELYATEMKSCNKKYLSGYHGEVEGSSKDLLEAELVKDIQDLNLLIIMEESKASKTVADKDYDANAAGHLATLKSARTKLEEKLKKFKAYNGSSAGVYDKAIALGNNITKGYKSVANTGGWNGKDGYITKGIDLSWSKDIKKEFLEKNVGKKGLENLKKLGYSENDIYKIFSDCKSDEDKKLLKLIANKDYDKAFKINPGKITEVMDIFLAGYSSKLFEKGKDDLSDLENFINAITRGDTDNLFNGKPSQYLKKLYSGSSFLLNQEKSLYSYNKELNEQERSKLKDRMKLYADMTSFWGSQFILFKKMGDNDSRGKNEGELAFGMTLKNLKYANGKFYFDAAYKYVTPRNPNHEMIDKNNILKIRELYKSDITTETVWSSTKTKSIIDIEIIRELEKSRADAFDNYFLNLTNSTVIAISPTAGLAMSLLTNFSKMEVKDGVSGVYNLLKEKNMLKENSSINSFNSAFSDFLDYQNNINNINTKIDKEKHNMFLEWFGSSGAYFKDDKPFLSHSGIYDPNTMDVMKEWEESGVSKFVSSDNPRKNEVINKLKKKYPNTKDTSFTKRTILYGGKNGSLEKVDMKEFNEFVSSIDSKLSDDKNDHSVKENFHKKMKRKKRG